MYHLFITVDKYLRHQTNFDNLITLITDVFCFETNFDRLITFSFDLHVIATQMPAKLSFQGKRVYCKQNNPLELISMNETKFDFQQFSK